MKHFIEHITAFIHFVWHWFAELSAGIFGAYTVHLVVPAPATEITSTAAFLYAFFALGKTAFGGLVAGAAGHAGKVIIERLINPKHKNDEKL